MTDHKLIVLIAVCSEIRRKHINSLWEKKNSILQLVLHVITSMGEQITLVFKMTRKEVYEYDVCPCIIYEIDERYPLDATIIIINNSTCFGHLYAHLQEY